MTLLLSYPGPTWHIRGASNFRSRARARVNPRGALREWLSFAGELAARGASLAVLPPPVTEPPLTGLLYAANYGALFENGGRRRFVLSRMSVPHRDGERNWVRVLVEGLGLETSEIGSRWEGQAEVCELPGARYLLTWGVRSERRSVDEISALLPGRARVLPLELREPFFHGDTCLNALTTPEGRTVLLCHEGAFVDARLADIERFASPDVEVLPVSEADALGYACNALQVGPDLLAPPGLSRQMRTAIEERGMAIVEIPLHELFGKGGGGPRCLVNELRGVDATLPPFGAWAPALEASLWGYPEEAPGEREPAA